MLVDMRKSPVKILNQNYFRFQVFWKNEKKIDKNQPVAMLRNLILIQTTKTSSKVLN